MYPILVSSSAVNAGYYEKYITKFIFHSVIHSGYHNNPFNIVLMKIFAISLVIDMSHPY